MGSSNQLGKTARMRQGARSAMARLEESFKLRYLGVGFIWAWVYCSYETSALYPDREGIGINADPSWLASATAVVVALFACGLLLRRTDLSRSRTLRSLAMAFVATGTVLSAIVGIVPLPAGIVYGLSGALSGTGTALLCLMWGDALSRLDVEQMEIAVPAASLATFLCVLVFPYLQGVVGVVAVTSLPLLSGGMLAATYHGLAAKRMLQPAGKASKGVRSEFGRIAVILFVAYFVIGCIGALQEAEEPFVQVFGFDLPTFIGSGFGIVLVVCFIFFSLKIDFTSLFRWLAPLVVLSLALFPWQDVLPSFVSSTIMAIADTCLQAVSYLYVIALAKRRFISVAVGIGTSQGALQLGVLAGNLAGEAASPLVASGSLNVFVVVLALICLFSFSLALLPARGGKAPMRAAAGGSEPAESAFAATCRQLAAANGLSAREEEVLGYLAKGRSQPYIREELLLSKNTVATHVKHIYQKLDVHSRQELLDLFETKG